MKFAEINAIYTKTVTEWLNKGYTINTDTMSGSQGEVAKIDLTDGKEIIRIMLARFSEGFIARGVEVVVGRAHEDNVKPNTYDGWSTIWTNHLEILSEQRFYQISERRNGEKIYGTMAEAEAAYEIQRQRRIARECEPGSVYSTEKAKEIARRFISRKTGRVRIKNEDISINKNRGVYRVYYRGEPYRLH